MVFAQEPPRLANGFDYPVGKPDGKNYYDAQNFGRYNAARNGYHLGEDWNRRCGGDCDFGDSVYVVANGEVKVKGFFNGWGGVVIVEHILPGGSKIYSQYGHLNNIQVSVGSAMKRGDIVGGMSKGDLGQYPAHLHFEIKTDSNPKKLDPWLGYSSAPKPAGWVDPSDFINSHRPIPKAVLTATDSTDTAAKLSWTKPAVNNFQKYTLYRSEVAGGTGAELSRALVSEFTNPDTLEHTDTNLTPEKDYFYKLFAFDNTGNFSESEEVSVKTKEKTFTTKNITQNSDRQDSPRMTDKYVVWDDARYVDGRITALLYLYDIEEEKVKTFPAGLGTGARHVSLPSIHGGKVVFEGSRSWAENIYVYDVEAYFGMGYGFMVEGTSYNYVVYPEIYNNIVAWEGYGNGTRQDIYYFDLENPEQGAVALTDDYGIQQSPSVWERKIVYRDTLNSNTKIVLADIDTKEKKVLFEGYQASGPKINQGIVSWVHKNILYYYDIDSKVTRILENKTVSHAITKEKKLIYFAWEGGLVGSVGSIRLYDTVTGNDKELVAGLSSSNFDYANGLLAYTDHSEFDNGSTNKDIFLMKVE